MCFGPGFIDLSNSLCEVCFEVQALACGGDVGSEEVDEVVPVRVGAVGVGEALDCGPHV